MSSVALIAENTNRIIYPHDDPLVVSLCMPTFEKMGLRRSCVKAISYPVIGFIGLSVVSEGTIKLLVKQGKGSQYRDLLVEFFVVDVPAAYNAITGRPLTHDAKVVVSTYHLTMIYTSNTRKSKRLKGN